MGDLLVDLLDHDRVVEVEGVGDQADPRQGTIAKDSPGGAARFTAEDRRKQNQQRHNSVQHMADELDGDRLAAAQQQVQEHVARSRHGPALRRVHGYEPQPSEPHAGYGEPHAEREPDEHAREG